jgi:hypothetical protein
VVLPTKPRIDAVLEIIEQAATKVIVFVPFKAVLRYVAEELRRELLPKSKADARRHDPRLRSGG